jgi:CubicO group peptidase (beta-lactamase class C family)
VTLLGEFLRREIEEGSFPGGAALVGSASAVLEAEHAGSAAVVPAADPLAGDTLFDLASLTKPLATGALAAAAVGLDLGSAPGRYFPGWKRTAWEGITIESLLTHTSGLPAWFPVYARGEGAAAYRRTLSQIDPEARPGSAVIYSDLNFLVLGEILETHFSAPLDAAFADLVARPCAAGARFLPPDLAKTAATEEGDATERSMAADLGISYAGFASGVIRGEVHDGNARHRGGVAGNAGLFGTAADVWALARRWLAAPRPDFTGDRTPGLSEARGLAWQGRRGAGSAVPSMSEKAFGHTGFTGTSVWLDPEADRVYVLLTNRIHPNVRPGSFHEVRRRFHETVRRM